MPMPTLLPARLTVEFSRIEYVLLENAIDYAIAVQTARGKQRNVQQFADLACKIEQAIHAANSDFLSKPQPD